MIPSPDLQDGNALEIWAGLECTINRVGDRFADQCALNGHRERPADLQAFADLGIKKIRYPVLWETIAPASLEDCDRDDVWKRPSDNLMSLRERGVDPIVGLLHHGSGPTYTDLLDVDFPQKLAAYAGKVARRFPWVNWYTPVNEPLTTARFSALYGVWYPHKQDDASFARALYNECKGTVLAMAAIREINPAAKLLQTDDLGKISSSPKLDYQAKFENNRRWLAFDLLCGKVDRKHYMYRYLTTRGQLTPVELEFFEKHPCVPDMIGINHYPLSNRFLDEELSHYPEGFHGSNGKHRYADVGAVDSGRAEITSIEELLRETWERYRLPIAVTEAHIAGHREHQLRWLRDIWQGAKNVKAEGVDVRAVTAWSLLGSFDWNSLCVLPANHYESGVFDLRTQSETPRATALAKAICSIATTGTFEHPVLDLPGYWKTDRRILFAPKPGLPESSFHSHPTARPILITGEDRAVAAAFAAACELRGLSYRLISIDEMVSEDPEFILRFLNAVKPWAIIDVDRVTSHRGGTDINPFLDQLIDGELQLGSIADFASVEETGTSEAYRERSALESERYPIVPQFRATLKTFLNQI